MPKNVIRMPAPRLEKVSRESTRDKVYTALRQAVLSGRLRCGERVTEIPLARELGVSRAILREAMLRLVHDGLFEFHPYRGARVVELRPDQIDEILEARLLLETQAVRLATGRITAAQREELRAAERELQREKDGLRASQLDFRLHQRIWQIAGQSAIEKLLVQLTAPMFAMSLLMRSAERRGYPTGSHRKLVQAICDGAPAEAARELETHLTENWTVIRARLAEFLDSPQEKRRVKV
jgi:DNA-binding GntR family transcriptional regulator